MTRATLVRRHRQRVRAMNALFGLYARDEAHYYYGVWTFGRFRLSSRTLVA